MEICGPCSSSTSTLQRMSEFVKKNNIIRNRNGHRVFIFSVISTDKVDLKMLSICSFCGRFSDFFRRHFFPCRASRIKGFHFCRFTNERALNKSDFLFVFFCFSCVSLVFFFRSLDVSLDTFLAMTLFFRFVLFVHK